MTDAELVAGHDSLIPDWGHSRPAATLDYYLTELAGRDADRQTPTTVRLTWVIAALTVVNVVAVIYSIAR